MAKTIEVRYNEAMVRMADRMGRTDEEQLSLIKKRRGKSIKETARLMANVLAMKVDAKKPVAKKPVAKKPGLPITRDRFKKGVRKNAS